MITCLNKDLVPKGLSNLNFIMPFYLIVIYSILFFRFNNLIKAIKAKKDLRSEIFTTLLSILIVVCLYLYISQKK